MTNKRQYFLFNVFFFIFSLYMFSGFTTLSSAGDEEYLPFAEQMPEPVGGLEAIYKKVQYPEMARNAGIQGKVYVLVFVSESGSVDDVKVLKDIGAGCGDAAANAIKKIKYKPGKNGGAAVKVKVSMAISFQIR